MNVSFIRRLHFASLSYRAFVELFTQMERKYELFLSAKSRDVIVLRCLWVSDPEFLLSGSLVPVLRKHVAFT